MAAHTHQTREEANSSKTEALLDMIAVFFVFAFFPRHTPTRNRSGEANTDEPVVNSAFSHPHHARHFIGVVVVVWRTNEAMTMMHDGDATPAQQGKSEGEGNCKINGIPRRAAVNDDSHSNDQC